jgi:diacylglycerol kinase family enzyme
MTIRLYAVVNPAAGQPKPVLHTLNSVCGNAGVDWAVSVTRGSGDAARFAQEALAEGFHVVAAFGGDGTVMEVASALVGGDVPVAILPGGTANVMSTKLGIPGDLTQACQLACGQNSTTKPVDMGQASERTFMLRVAMGLDADHVIGATREMKDRYGELAYTISALRQMTHHSDAFHHWQAREITIEADPPQHVIGDGELWGETPISLKVLPQAVRFLVPET